MVEVPEPSSVPEHRAAPDPVEEPYRSLYRRYRPQRFDEVRGQDHVTRALRNAVREEKVAHAYLFSGPRGTGKTSTARILAMALNCEHPADGEPDGTCPSCTEIRRGASVDVHELDAASNRKLDEMRELLSRVALGTTGRWKVYIVDEVHQLTSDAASALLKTLEEPPGHVVFVLATTDPQKVLPTIRSRTQHFEFRLLGAEVLGRLLTDVNHKAALGLPPEAIDLVVRRGHGSARDALSVLDQVAAAGDVEDEAGVVGGIVDALADRDPGRVLTGVAEAISAGRDPRRLAIDLLEQLRNGFLATQARSLVLLPDDAVAEVEEQARRLGLAGVVRALEVVGQAGVDMREAIDPRVTLEAALVRLAAPEITGEVSGLLERIERLEHQLVALSAPPRQGPREGRPEGDGRHVAPPAPPPPMPGRQGPPTPQGARASSPGPAPRAALGAHRQRPPAEGVGPEAGSGPGSPPPPRGTAGGPPAPPGGRVAEAPARPGPPTPSAAAAPTKPEGPHPDPAPAPSGPQAAPSGPQAGPSGPQAGPSGPQAGPSGPQAAPGGLRAAPGGPQPAPSDPSLGPNRDELTKAWGDRVLPGLRPALKAYIAAGRFVASDDGPVYALPDRGLLTRALPLQPEIEAALSAHFGRPVTIRLVVDGQAAPARPEEAARDADEDTAWDLDDLQDAGPAVASPEQRLLEAFPGAEEVTP